MKYIIKSFDQYYIRDCEGHIEEIYDLEQATVFNTTKEAKSLIDSTTYAEYFKVIEYSKELKKFLEWKKKGMIRRELSKISNWSRSYRGEGLTEVINFHIFNSENGAKVKFEHYNTWPNVNKFLKFFYDHETYASNNGFKKFHTFQIMIKQDISDFKKFKKELETLIPYTSYKEDEYFIFSIFDKDLSEYGTRYLYYNPETDEAIIKGGYSDTSKRSLEECYKIMEREYYYE